MNRRGFLTGGAALGGVSAVGLAATGPKESEDNKGFWWTVQCGADGGEPFDPVERPYSGCGHTSSTFVNMLEPLKIGNQCPRCLRVLDLSTTLLPLIDEWNERHGRGHVSSKYHFRGRL